MIGLDRVQTLILKTVGLDLVGQTDAAPFLPHVQEHSTSGFLDHLERSVHLFTAIAAHRTEDVAGQALRVHADQDRFRARDVAADKRHVMIAVQKTFVEEELELPVARRHDGFHDAPHQDFGPPAIGDEIADGDDLEPEVTSQPHETWHPRHLSVVVHDLAEHTCRVEPGQPCQVDRRFRVTGPAQHPAVLRPQGKDVTRAREILSPHGLLGERTNGSGAILG